MTPAHWQLLRATSRSFYLSLRVLPRPVREPIGLAYLLARTTDTVADAEQLPVDDRLQLLDRMRRQIAGLADPGPLPLPRPANPDAARPEEKLLLHWPASLAALGLLPPEDQNEVRTVLHHILNGQTWDLARFGTPGRSPAGPIAVTTAEELDHYTYCVAGSVGEFWSRVCRRHLFPREPLREPEWLAQAVQFGKGLQLVNVLRDCAADLRQGRCYLPAVELQALGLQPPDLLDPQSWPRVKPCYEHWRQRAMAFLEAGWAYTLAIPARQKRLRLACAWPLLLGVRTLQELGRVNPLDPAQRVKIPRREVRRWIWRSLAGSVLPRVWARLFHRALHTS